MFSMITAYVTSSGMQVQQEKLNCISKYTRLYDLQIHACKRNQNLLNHIKPCIPIYISKDNAVHTAKNTYARTRRTIKEEWNSVPTVPKESRKY
ncbi:hypothetical protein BRADI_4g30091v3 [Brachypodium distachyon]|uniref:Uncharacterized protein n=1 Tax=Brachypodium distachyon TaxID=15368 RepID=A0A0Q3ERV9_BRADI|nr:hypothetical protein BRADI_4g30091v3 [Brachypodium distachyon]